MAYRRKSLLDCSVHAGCISESDQRAHHRFVEPVIQNRMGLRMGELCCQSGHVTGGTFRTVQSQQLMDEQSLCQQIVAIGPLEIGDQMLSDMPSVGAG